MDEHKFYLYTDQQGARWAFYVNPNGRKLVEDFSKIPFTGDSLLEDILNEFSGFPWGDGDLDCEYDYYTDGLIGASIDDFTLGDEKVFVLHFTELARVFIGDEAASTEIHTSKMNENERQLFGEFQIHLNNYCQENNIELYIWNEAMEDFE